MVEDGSHYGDLAAFVETAALFLDLFGCFCSLGLDLDFKRCKWMISRGVSMVFLAV